MTQKNKVRRLPKELKRSSGAKQSKKKQKVAKKPAEKDFGSIKRISLDELVIHATGSTTTGCYTISYGGPCYTYGC